MGSEEGKSMKYLKLTSLLVLAAVAALVAIGAGSASATVICEESASPCPEGKVFPSETVLTGHSSNIHFDFHDLGQQLTCSSDIEIETDSNNPGNPLSGQVTDFTISSCTGDTTYCYPWPTVNTPWETSLESTGNGEGNLKVTGTEGQKVSFYFEQCGWEPNKHSCNWSTSELNFKLSPSYGETPSLSMNEATLTTGNCKNLTVSTSPYTLDLEAEPLHGTWILEEPNYALGPVKVECSSALEGSGLGQSAGTISGLSFSGCTGSCQTAAPNGLSYSTQFTAGKGEDGTVKISGTFGPSRIELTKCLGKLNVICRYGITALRLGSSGLYADHTVLNRESSNSLCPLTVKMSTAYAVGGPWVESN